MILVLIATGVLALLLIGIGLFLVRILQVALALLVVIGFILLNLVVWTSVGIGAAAGALVSMFAGPGHDALPWLVAISVSIFSAALLLRALFRRFVAWYKRKRNSPHLIRPAQPQA